MSFHNTMAFQSTLLKKSIFPTIVALTIALLLMSCLPWRPPEETIGIETNTEIKEAAEIKGKDSTSQTKQLPFQPSRIPAPGSFIEVTATVTHPASILGKKGFLPAELTIEAGDSVTWTNADPQKKKLVLTFQKINTREFITSPSLPPEKEWDYVFTEPVEYVYWTTGYGVKGRLIVKESNS